MSMGRWSGPSTLFTNIFSWLSYNLLYFVLTYGLPLVIMLLAYLQMGRKLWCQKNIGEDTPTLAKCRKTKQKVIPRNLFNIQVPLLDVPN